MVARLLTSETPVKITQENHPENAPKAPAEKPTTFSIAAAVSMGALCSLVGMTIGAAAFSTLQQTGTVWELICMIPLIATLCCFMGGWVGGFFHLIRSE